MDRLKSFAKFDNETYTKLEAMIEGDCNPGVVVQICQTPEPKRIRIPDISKLSLAEESVEDLSSFAHMRV
jgi:hypothetical protein